MCLEFFLFPRLNEQAVGAEKDLWYGAHGRHKFEHKKKTKIFFLRKNSERIWMKDSLAGKVEGGESTIKPKKL